MSKRPSTPTRLTKAERKEQARRERAELQRKMARTKRTRRILTILTALVTAGAIAFAVTRPGPEVADPQDLLARADTAVAAAGCTDIENVGPYQPDSQDQAHVPTEETPPFSRYPSIPPASGPHNGVPLGAGVYSTPPAVDRLIHSLEHGGVTIWYAPDASAAAVEKLTTFYRENSEAGARVIVAPYDYAGEGAAGQLPAGTSMALVAWHTVRTCTDVDVAAAFDFSSRYAFPAFGGQEYAGEAPEPGAAM